MNMIGTVALLACVLVWQGGPSQPQPFSVSITGPSGPVKGGDKISISIVVTNTSKQTIILSRVNGGEDVSLRDYAEIVVYRPTADSIVVPATSIRPKLGDRDFDVMRGELKPNESFVDVLRPARYFDMSKPGAYFVRLARKIPDYLGNGQIQSNQIEIDVVE